MFLDGRYSGSSSRLRIAVVGAGVSGLAAAWLLSQKHDVTVFEAELRPGGHSCTVETGRAGDQFPVDMGFIVYNEVTYPNLTAMFRHLKIATKPSEMTFACLARQWPSRIFGDRYRRLAGSKAQPLPPALLVDAARPFALLSRSAARCSLVLGLDRASATISTAVATGTLFARTTSIQWPRRFGRCQSARSPLIRPPPS